jgi:hypothetical protein
MDDPWYASMRPALFEDLPREAADALKDASPLARRGALGLVLEVPVDAGLETVGAYSNGAFRYYNASAGASIVLPETIPSLNDAARDLALLGNGLIASDVRDDEMRLTVIEAAARRECSGSTRLAQLISEKALMAVQACVDLREAGAAPPAPAQEPKPIVYQYRVTAAATEKNARCLAGERHRILCWSTTSDEPVGRFFAGYLADDGWSDVTLEKTLAFLKTPEWSEPQDPNVITSFEQAQRIGWSVLVFGAPLE